MSPGWGADSIVVYRTVFGDKVLRERLVDSGKFDISVEVVDSL